VKEAATLLQVHL